MTKAQIHFSNDLTELIEALKQSLYPEGAQPFEKRLIIVPHLGMKRFLMQSLARDEMFQVAAGLSIVNLSQGAMKVSKEPFPSALELSLFLQHELLPLIEKDHELRRYFGIAAREKRIGPFCDTLAQHFLRYAVYGPGKLSGFREALWKKARSHWRFPIDLVAKCEKKQVHLFGFAHLPASYFSLFEGAHFYFFSPCSVYWGDYVSEREKKEQLDLFDEGQNPLLRNLGKVGRKMHVFLLDHEGEERYVQRDGEGALSTLQRSVLEGVEEKVEADETIECFTAYSKLREVELLRDRLYPLFSKGALSPQDVMVFAPDIAPYAPYIEATFFDVAVAISDLKATDVDPLAMAFEKLLSLGKNRFSLDALLHLFASPPFQEKFGLNLSLFKKWAKTAHIRWGFSTEQRKTLFLKGAEEAFLKRNPKEGTLLWGLNRLILGLGNHEGEGAPLPIVEMTEVEALDAIYRVVTSLASDFEPMLDGTRWTIPTWLRYFACLMEAYFTFDPSHDLYKELLQLASSLDRLDRQKVPFDGVERVLASLLSKKGKTVQPPHLGAIRFASLAEGCALPAKVICMIGMEEENFPGSEEESSLYGGEVDYRPRRSDQMRMAALSLFLSARKHFFVSAVGDSPFMEELLQEIEGSTIQQEGRTPTPEEKPIQPLIPSLYLPSELRLPENLPKEIDIQKLFKFARHPLRFYFHEVLGIRPDFGGGEEREFLLDPLTKHKLVREAFAKPIDEVFQQARERGELSENLLTDLAKEQIEKELALYQVYPEEVKIEPIRVGDVWLTGTLDNFTLKGLLVKGKDALEDRVRFFPVGLIAKELGMPLIFLKTGKEGRIEGSLEAYIDYFLRAQTTPSLFLPSLAKAFLEGTGEDLAKGLDKVGDEIFDYLFLRDPLPDATVLHANWSSYLQTIFGGVDATV